ncbi:MAG: hypothetical protein ACRDQ5_10495 [Sciscionella sp.]
MLALTPTALKVVRSITEDETTPDGAGLRIATSPDNTTEGALELSVATAPAADDQVLTGEGARIFLEPSAAVYLDDKVLDADVDESGQPTFALAEQDGDSAQH